MKKLIIIIHLLANAVIFSQAVGAGTRLDLTQALQLSSGQFNASGLPSGINISRMTAGNYSSYKKMLLLK